MVREGMGLAILPAGIARNYEARLGLVVLPLTDAWAARQLYLCVRDVDALSPQAGALLAHLLAV
jgi:DNA-binding transcriptional LysR family regulator